MSGLSPDLEARHSSLRGDVQAALDQSAEGRSEPLDVDSIKKELTDELDEHGRGK